MSGVVNDEDKKPADQSAHINLKVKGQDRQDGNEVFFRIKRSTQLKKLVNAYCDRQSLSLTPLLSCLTVAISVQNRLQMSWKWTETRQSQCFIRQEELICSELPFSKALPLGGAWHGNIGNAYSTSVKIAKT